MPTTFITPVTEVRAYTGVPLDASYVNTRDFETPAEQRDWFWGRLYKVFTRFTFQRMDGYIRVPLAFDDALKINYVSYFNQDEPQKWIYAFVLRAEYVDPATTNLYIKTDVLQTWMFDWSIKGAYIERETVESDRLFEHTIPENLETGPYNVQAKVDWSLGGSAIVVAYVPFDQTETVGELRDGVFSGVKYLYFGITPEQIAALNSFLSSASSAGKLDNIIALLQVPYSIITGTPLDTTLQTSFTRVDGYAPYNRKLFCYPYRYLALNNCRGTEVEYRYELADDPSNMPFKALTVFNLKSQCLMYPQDYAGQTNHVDEGVIIDSFPFCSWVGNVYANYIARNASQLQNGLIQAFAGQVAATVTPGAIPALGAAQAFLNVRSFLAPLEDKSHYPYQIQGQVDADVGNIAWDRVGYEFKQYSITAEYAKVIDQYFQRFGYQVNRYGLPKLRSRLGWNFIRCADITITGPMPQDHLEEIKGIFTSGVTFWHDDDIGNYLRANPGAGVGRSMAPASAEAEEEYFRLTNNGYEEAVENA